MGGTQCPSHPIRVLENSLVESFVEETAERSRDETDRNDQINGDPKAELAAIAVPVHADAFANRTDNGAQRMAAVVKPRGRDHKQQMLRRHP